MEIKKYAESLKKILDFAHVRYNVLSQAIEYDLSYVSKWTTGARLPAAKNVDCINQKIADFLAPIILKQKQRKEFSRVFLHSDEWGEEDLSFTIYQYLGNAYRTSLKEKKNCSNTVNVEHLDLSIGMSECQTLIQHIVKSKLEDLTEPANIVITGDFLNLVKNHFWQIFYDVKMKEFPCNIHVALNVNELQNNSINATGSIFQCLNDFLDFDFTIYEKSSKLYDNIIAIENKAVILYYINAEGYIDMSIAVYDSHQVKDIYNKCKSFIMTQPVVLQPKNTLGMDRFGFRDTFYASDKFFFFCANGLEFLLPNEVFQSLLKAAKTGNLEPATEEWVQRVHAIWETVVNRVSLRFMLPTNSIIRYLETGYIHLTDFSYQLTTEERRLHMKHILDEMKSNPAIVFGVLLPTTEKYSGTNFTNLSFNTNYSTGFLKKNVHCIHEDTLPIYLVNSVILLRCLQNFFDSQTQSKHYKEYSVEQLAELYEKYHFLMEFLFKE